MYFLFRGIHMESIEALIRQQNSFRLNTLSPDSVGAGPIYNAGIETSHLPNCRLDDTNHILTECYWRHEE